MQSPTQLLESEDHWVTDMGAWFPAERVVFRGKNLFHDLKDLPWMGLLLYGITGRIPSDEQIRLFDGIWRVCCNYPDPRLWNNRVAALAGTARSTATLGVSAAIAISEATIYGHQPLIATLDFLLRIKSHLHAGSNLEDALTKETGITLAQSDTATPKSMRDHAIIPGFGRPITPTDERIPPLLRLAEELGYAQGATVRLAFDIEAALRQHGKPLRMNIAALMAGLAADQGLTPGEFYHYTVLCFSGGMIPCYIDTLSKPESTLFPLRCERIAYSGNARRVWNSL